MANPLSTPLATFRRQRKRELWIAPIVGALLAGILASFALAVDVRVDWEGSPAPIFVGHPDTARTALSVMAASVTTLLALILTIIAVVIQVATGHFSPRAIATLLQDRPSHFTIGVFVGTFAYALVVLVHLRFAVENEETVAGLAVTLAFGLAIVSIATFAVYANHIIHSVRVSSLINRIAAVTRETVDRRFPSTTDSCDPDDAPRPRLPGNTRVIETDRAGMLVDRGEERLADLAEAEDCVVRVTPSLGSYIPHGFPLLEVGWEGDRRPPELSGAMELIGLEEERNPDDDVGFGLRQLTDIAVRALSPSVNDPATAVRVIDQLHDLLRRLVSRDLTEGSRIHRNGRLRVVVEPPSWKEVEHCIDELRLYGKGSLPAVRRLRAMLEDVRTVAPQARAASLERQLHLLDEITEAAFEDEASRELSREPDLRGSGF